MSATHIQTREEFMHHAYNALFSEKVHEFPLELRVRVIAEISQDLCRVVRTLPREAQDEFLHDIREQVRDS